MQSIFDGGATNWKKNPKVPCPICSTLFRKKHHYVLTCSRACGIEHRKRRKDEDAK